MTSLKHVKPSSGHKRMGHKTKKNLILSTMALPVTIWLLLLRYIPMAGISLAFVDYKIYTKSPNPINNLIHSKFVGLKNFEFLFSTSDAMLIIRNTVCYNIVWIILGFVIAITLAIMMNELTHKFVAKTYQTMMFFPYFLSWVVVSYFVLALLDPTYGMIVKSQLANSGVATNWYHDPAPWPIILTICSIWKNTGYSTILYLAEIAGIDNSYYEAAAIDGATKWQQIKYVTLPCIRNMVVILLILNVGKIFNADFGLFWSVPLNSGSLYSVTNVLDTYIYRALMTTQDIGMSTAGGLFQNVVGCLLVLATDRIAKRVDSESGLF